MTLITLLTKSIVYKMLVRSHFNMLMKCRTCILSNVSRKLNKITEIHAVIFQECCRDNDTSLFINLIKLDSPYIRRLIKQATMSYNIHYSLDDICPPSYIQHANHISSRTDHQLKYCNKNPSQIAHKYSFLIKI